MYVQVLDPHATHTWNGAGLTWRMKMHFGKNMISGTAVGGRHCKTKGQTLQPFPSPIAWSTMQIGKPEKRNAHTCTHTHTHPATKITLHIGWRPINWQEKRDLGAWVLCLGDYLPHAPFAFCFLQKSRGQWTQTQRR